MKKALKILGVVLLLAAAAVIWILRERELVYTYGGASLTGPGDNLSPKQRDKRWRSQVDFAVRSACSNELGFYRLLNFHTDTDGDNPSKWTARAEVEVITGAVGIERRTLHLAGASSSGNLYFHGGRTDTTADLWRQYSNRIAEIDAGSATK